MSRNEDLLQLEHSSNISIDQEKYIEDLLEKFSMHNCKPVATPLIPNSTVNKEEPDTSLDQHDVTTYPEMRGQRELTIVAVCTFAYTSG